MSLLSEELMIDLTFWLLDRLADLMRLLGRWP